MSYWISEPYQSAERLEDYLGDPLDPRSPFSFERTLAYDERDEFPVATLEHVRASGFDRYMLVPELGGTFDTCEGNIARHRALARRDFSVDIALGAAYLAYLPVWCGGSIEQQRRFAKAFLDHRLAALALTEITHGADLLATETTATRTPDGWSLDGTKWLINNATRAELVCVLAKTGMAGTKPSLSLLIVDKTAVAASSYEHLPKVKLHGTRGMDVAGIRFKDCKLPEHAVVGAPGVGIELVLKGFAFSRTMCAARSLGAADTALRSTIAFARQRRLYGDSVLAISHARAQLTASFADLLLCDCIATASARALHVTPGQASLTSAITKYLVPVTSEHIVDDSAVILGARHFLREDHWGGIFQKLRRDNELISLFDGSTIVSLSAISSQLGALSMGRREDRRTEVGARARALYHLAEPIPPFSFPALELSCRGRNDVLDALAGLPSQLETARASSGTPTEVVDELVRIAKTAVHELTRIEDNLQVGFRAGWAVNHRSAESIELARRYCLLHGVAAGLHVWLHNRELFGGGFARGEWLVLAAERMLSGVTGARDVGARVDLRRVGDDMMSLFDEGRAFAIVPYCLANANREAA